MTLNDNSRASNAEKAVFLTWKTAFLFFFELKINNN